MIKNFYGKSRGYESIGSVYPEENDIVPKIIKCIFYLIIVMILILIIIYFFKQYHSKKDLEKGEIKQLQFQEKKIFALNDFSDILPKINENTPISNKEDLFKSRTLYINEKNVTNDYIRFIRPINQEEEEKNKKYFFGNINFDNYQGTKKEGKLSLNDFYNLCNKDKLIDLNIVPKVENPDISIIIPLLHKKQGFMKSMNSIKSQTFNNIEIIIVDDCPEEKNEEILKYLFENESRLRIFRHSKKLGLWRSRLDGYLYSKGKYILHFDSTDIFADNYVLEDIYNLIVTYYLDTVRYTFSRTIFNNEFLMNQQFAQMKIYPPQFTKIIYGRPNYDVHKYGYGTIWNRLVRAGLYRKGLDLVDECILNAYKNLWEDMWWNDLIDRVSYSNLVVNRLGYVYFHTRESPSEPKIADPYEKDQTIREFIYFWYFDYVLLPKEDNKKLVIETLRKYIRSDSTFFRMPLSIVFLTSNCPIYDHLLLSLFKDKYISDKDRNFIKELYYKSPKNKLGS